LSSLEIYALELILGIELKISKIPAPSHICKYCGSKAPHNNIW
jgi:hypothetical protein